jgi:uncharacterized membrane protein YhfC
LEQLPRLGNGWLATALATILFEIAFPPLIAVSAYRRLGVGWRYFAYGALIFLLFQVVTRIPAVQVLQLVLGPQLNTSPVLSWLWLGFRALTAGVFEEMGRYVGYRWLMRREEKTWAEAVMYGLGHGGLESIFVAGLLLATVVGLLSLTEARVNTLPEPQRVQVVQQLSALSAQPDWFPLLGAWERACSICLQVMLSVLVLQVFRRRSLQWLGLAILAHTAIDGIAAGVPKALGQGTLVASVAAEAVITVLAVVAVWVTWGLREPGPHGHSTSELSGDVLGGVS